MGFFDLGRKAKRAASVPVAPLTDPAFGGPSPLDLHPRSASLSAAPGPTPPKAPSGHAPTTTTHAPTQPHACGPTPWNGGGPAGQLLAYPPQQSLVPYQPAGHPPAGWGAPWPHPPPGGPHHCPQAHWPQQPIVVNQHYYLMPAAAGGPAPGPAGGGADDGRQKSKMSLGKLNLGSVVNMVAHEVLPPSLDVNCCGAAQLFSQSAALYDDLSAKFNDMMTGIETDRFKGREADIIHIAPPPGYVFPNVSAAPPGHPLAGPVHVDGPADRKETRPKGADLSKGQATTAAVFSGSLFSKVDMYANSRLPLKLPPFKVHLPTYQLLCLAAQYSERVYEKPRGAERDAVIGGCGQRAMVLKSAPMDELDVIVFAVRGTSTFMDWAVNLNMAPASPLGFLDDPGNLCHAGFLAVARSMVKPVAARLRSLLEEDPSRASYSLLITGHSAGGAVAALLYAHMLATTRAAESELNTLAGCFRRIHCVTFGTPPLSLLPLRMPDMVGGPAAEPRQRVDKAREEWVRKSLFITFLNEGDPVARAGRAYVKSLLELLAHPAPVLKTVANGVVDSVMGFLPGGGTGSGTASANTLAKTSTNTSSSSASESKKKSKKKEHAPRKESSKTSLASTSKASSRSKNHSSSAVSTVPSPSSASLAVTTSSTRTTTTSSSSSSSRPRYNVHHPGPVWGIPPGELSTPGSQIVILRSGNHRPWDPASFSRHSTPHAAHVLPYGQHAQRPDKGRRRKKPAGAVTNAAGLSVEERLDEGVVAQVVTDDLLRGVVWGDPVAHVMRLYSGRVECLAVGAVVGGRARR